MLRIKGTVAVVRVAREALDLWERLRDLRVLLRRLLRLRHVEVLRDLNDCRRRWGLEGLAARVAICGACVGLTRC